MSIVTYNSTGLVKAPTSLNSSDANLHHEKVGSDSDSLDVEELENGRIVELFQAVINGLNPRHAFEVFKSVKSTKNLSRIFSDIFYHGMYQENNEVSVAIIKEFHQRSNFIEALIDSLNMIASKYFKFKYNQFVSLIIKICKMLGPLQLSINSFIVDILVKMISPRVEKKLEKIMVSDALEIIENLGQGILDEDDTGFELVEIQLKAGLFGEGYFVETKALLLESIVNLRILKSSKVKRETFCQDEMVGDAINLVKDNSLKCEENSKSYSEISTCTAHQMEANGGLLSKSVNPEASALKREQSNAEETIEEQLNDHGLACSYALDLKKVRESLVNRFGDRCEGLDIGNKGKQEAQEDELVFADMSIQEKKPLENEESDGNRNALGKLLGCKCGKVFKVVENCTIGRDNSCTVVLPSKEVSRVHCRIFSVEDNVMLETLSKTNNVRINSMKISKATILCHGDKILMGRELFEWQDTKDGLDPQQIGNKNVIDDVATYESKIVSIDSGHKVSVDALGQFEIGTSTRK